MRLAGQMLDTRVRQQVLHSVLVAAQGASVEHGLRALVGHACHQRLQEMLEVWRPDTHHQARVGAELPAAQHHRGGQLSRHLLTASLQSLWQHDHRVDTAHFGEYGDRLRARCGHVVQGAATAQRAGKADCLDGWVLDQRFAHTGTVDHVENACRHAAAGHGSVDGRGHMGGSEHVPAVRLEHHRAAGGQRRSGVTASGGEGQREVAGAEHGHRAHADAVLAQVRARQRGALGQGAVDACSVEVATPYHLGKQAQLVAGAAAFAADACFRQCGFAHHVLDEVITQRVQFAGDRVEKSGALVRAGAAVARVGHLGGLRGGLHLVAGRLVEGVGQCFTGVGVEAVQQHVTVATELAGDVVKAVFDGHFVSRWQ